MSSSSSVTGDVQTLLEQREHKELVRVLTCGSVDDGKSTLIGRLFLDENIISTDALEALERDSAAFGTVQGGLDPALLTDGLKAEREQGITIDVSYRYFSSEKRNFIIADTPGHEQYTRNMATGASTADLAIVLLDARNGVLEQTRRHSFIISLLGIAHVIVAVNKMDLVNFDEEVFYQIEEEFTKFAGRLDTKDISFVPISALQGDNVVEPSANMPWYKGGTILHLLNTKHVASDRNLVDFRFPVQYVNRPHADYRGYAGTVASGVIRQGDEVVILPTKKHTTIQSIDTFDGPVAEAFASMAVTLTLADEVDASRGNMIVRPGNLAHMGNRFEAMLVWLDEEALDCTKEYVIKHTTKQTRAKVEDIRYDVNVNTFSRNKNVQTLALNHIGRCALQTAEPLFFDAYKRNKSTGSFILIDRITHKTVGAGMIIDRLTDEAEDTQKKVHPIFWLTGNTGAGKSTLAFGAKGELEQYLSHSVIVLDGDEMRETISEQESLSAEDRRRHNLRVARLAKLLQEQGALVIVSLIAPFADLRKQVDAICSPQWIYVQKDGLEANDKPYEPPTNSVLIIDHNTLEKPQALHKFVECIHSLL